MRESTARGSASTSFSSNTRRLLAVYAIASLPLLANAAAGNYAYFTDRDSGGGALYGGAPVWVYTAAACQAACTADPNCYGWTFNIPSIATWAGPCYLKGTNNCDATALNKVQPTGKYASGVIGDSCTVTCNKVTVSVGSGNCAVVTPTPTSTKAANRYRRDLEERKANEARNSLCPSGQTACPIGKSLEAGYECVDLREELESCGACGNDCTALPGTKDVTCSRGKCIVQSCAPGFALSPIGTCNKAPKLAHRRPNSDALPHARRRSAL